MDLKTFLLARIAEDEETAQGAIDSPTGAEAHWMNVFKEVEGANHRLVAGASSSWYADHIARHDPARVIAECAAKREIVEHWAVEETLVRLLNVLAAVYADHPDYQPEWAQGES